MSSQTNRTYDSDCFEGRKMMHVSVSGTLLGTVATTAASVELFKVPTGVYGRILGAGYKVTNGGTGDSASPQFGIGISLAGTGDIVVAASSVYGTRADNTYITLSPVTTANEFIPGDVVSTIFIAGTVADTSQVYTCQLVMWQETAV